MQQSKAITNTPGLPMCITPTGRGGLCKRPAIARISGRFPDRHVCPAHLEQAQAFYAKEPLARREDIEYLTARASNR